MATRLSQLERAEALVRDGRVRADPDAEPGGLYWVQGGDPSKEYRVQFLPDGYVSCTCTHGLNASGKATCYHVMGVELFQEEERG